MVKKNHTSTVTEETVIMRKTKQTATRGKVIIIPRKIEMLKVDTERGGYL